MLVSHFVCVCVSETNRNTSDFFTCSACEWTDYDERWQALHDHYRANAEYDG